jgi:hypothetical protein
MHTAIANQQASEQRLQGKRVILRMDHGALGRVRHSLARFEAILASWKEEQEKRTEREQAERHHTVSNVRIERPRRT